MNELFRFLSLRAPKKNAKSGIFTITIDSENALAASLKSATGQGSISRRSKMIEVATSHVESIKSLHFSTQYIKLYHAIKNASDAVSSAELIEFVEQAFGGKLDRIIQDKEFVESDKNDLAQFLIAAKAANYADGKYLKKVMDAYRMIALIEDLLSQNEIENAKKYLTALLLLPEDIFPLPSPFEGIEPIPPSTDHDKDQQRMKELQARANEIEYTMDYLMNLESSDYEDLDGQRDEIVPERSVASNANRSEDRVEQREYNGLLQKIPRFLGLSPVRYTGASSPEDNQAPQRDPLIIRAEVINNLDDRIKNVVNRYSIEINNTPVPEVISRLEVQLTQVINQLAKFDTKKASKTVVHYGSAKLEQHPAHPATKAEYTPSIPHTHGRIKPAGIGDLYVVKEQIIKYEEGEIAHIENALKGEKRERLHRKLDRSEETSIYEEETIKEEEEELATAERFEMKQETSKVIAEEIKNKSGYGFSIETGGKGSAGAYEFYIDAGFQYNSEDSSETSIEESSQQSSSFARDVTSKAANRISERKREELIKKVIQEIEETNTHSLDNTGGTGHIVGIYQWINKVYQVQKYNYGKHMMFDIMVPEPGAFFREALLKQPPEGAGTEEPEEYEGKASDLTYAKALTLAKKYKVTGIERSPARYITLAKVFAIKATDKEGINDHLNGGEEIKIPQGYKAISAHAVVSFGYFSEIEVKSWSLSGGEMKPDEQEDVGKKKAHVRITIGKKSWDKKPDDSVHHDFTLNWETENIPVAYRTVNTTACIISIEIKCQRTKKAYNEWQLKTHDQIQQQYLNLKAEYEEAIAAADIRQGIKIQGRNPEINRQIEKTELKKLFLSMITNQHFDLFNAFEDPSRYSWPQLNIPEAEKESLYIRFFEQAFRWEQMTYVLYPYFWSRKPNWLDRLFIEDTDPLHAEFLKAGAARVVLAVRHGFEKAVIHFLQTGDIPRSEMLIDMNSPMYLPIVDEIQENQGASPDGILEDTWDITIPTELIKLRPIDTETELPVWDKANVGGKRPDRANIDSQYGIKRQ